MKNTIAQQAMGQAIDFTVSGTADHSYKITNTTEENTTLHHAVQQLNFDFEGMGQRRSFKSSNKKDMDGPFGKPIKEVLEKEFDLIIDSTGTAKMAMPENIALQKPDDRFALIANMLKDLTAIALPPEKGGNSFFKVLPNQPVNVGDTWMQEFNNAGEKSATTYTLSAITDSTIDVDFRTRATVVSQSEMMGMPMTSNMNSVATGKIILDKATGIMREKTINIESTGTTEAMGNSMPLNAKSMMKIKVTPVLP